MVHSDDPRGTDAPPDYRFSLANERTFLAWVRTSVALIAGGLIAAKGIPFHHEAWRWAVATPPIVGGGALVGDAAVRLRRYEQAMRDGRALPARLLGPWLAVGVCAYACLVLAATLWDR